MTSRARHGHKRAFRRRCRQPATWLEALESRVLMDAVIDLMPLGLNTYEEAGVTVVEVTGGASFTVQANAADGSPAASTISSFQLNFAASDVAPGELTLSNWTLNTAVFGLALGQPLSDTNRFVGGAVGDFDGVGGDDGFATAALPATLGTLLVQTPLAGGDYLLSVNVSTGVQATLITSDLAFTAQTLDSYGDLIIRVTAPPVSVTGMAWIDTDQDGVRDDGEPVRPGVAVSLMSPGVDQQAGTGDDVVIASATTSDAGTYSFASVPAEASYSVRFDTESPSYPFTVPDQGGDDLLDSDVDPATGRTAIFVLGPAENRTHVDAGLLRYQAVTTPGEIFVQPGATVLVPLTYHVSDGDATLSGLGLRIHYNSQALTLAGFAEVFIGGLQSQVTTPQADTADLDGDAGTDVYAALVWQDAGGAWPNVALPALLASAQFTVSGTWPVGQATGVNLSGSATASGYVFVGEPATITVRATTLDVDDNGIADALTDGILIMRYLAGRTGAALVAGGPFGAGAQRTDPAAIIDYLDGSLDMLDPDGDGLRDLGIDGWLVMRHLFGFTGAALTTGLALGQDATRTDAADISGFLGLFTPVNGAPGIPAPSAPAAPSSPASATPSAALAAAALAWQQGQTALHVAWSDESADTCDSTAPANLVHRFLADSD